MNSLKRIAVDVTILFLIFAVWYSIGARFLPGLLICSTIVGVILSVGLVCEISDFIDDSVENKYNRMFPLPANVIEFPTQ